MAELYNNLLNGWELISDNYQFLLNGMWVTLRIAVTAIIAGIILGTILAIMRLSPNKFLVFISKCYVNTFRSIPLVMVLAWFYLLVPNLISSVFNLSPTTDIHFICAVVAFSLFEAAYYSEIIRAGFQSVPRGQVSASLALGMTPWQSMTLVIMPQAFRSMIPLLLTQGIVLFQDVTLVYAIEVTDFFKAANIVGGNSMTDTTTMILFAGAVYFIICFSASSLVNFFKKRTV